MNSSRRQPVPGSIARVSPGALAVLALLSATPLSAQEASDGYPIDDPTVVAECSSCHVQDEDGRLSRISWLRKTPEGWQTSLQRMMALHDVELTPDAARRIVRYLANEQGLAPEELRPGLFEVERRRWSTLDHQYTENEDVEEACITCHSMGRVITQRRTTEEWGLLLATHRALYPLVDFQAFRRASGDGEHPMDVAIEHLGEAFPLETPEWSAWSATMRAPRLAGEWALTGTEPGKGSFHGTLSIAADAADPAAFTTQASYVYAESGARVERSGQALVYTGYQWRGRSNPGQGSELREVMLVERDLQSISGRWFAGAYDELGPDVTLRRIGPGPLVTGAHPKALLRGTTNSVTVYGANLGAVGEDLDFGAGVRIESIESRTPESLRLRLAVAAEAQVGRRDLYAAGAVLEGAVVVHDGIDRIEVTPRNGMARAGGAAFPKAYETFEASGWNDGPDGEPGTEDDLALGRVQVTWRLEEYAATYGDDDIGFVGRILEDGTFEPALDGPNPERSGNRNNIGDVWVVATYTDADGRELAARAHLIVTVPLYMRFNPWPVPGQEPGRAEDGP
ncbi:MAG TPA: quinohemoprotein amine dehydrogenase subunit alpha [Candidatus Limnocylindrales bacterium]|nr:quinohemoprotein amine dehydrogenase subunit alpha [Candidatus Limnocylindrales bacterium]